MQVDCDHGLTGQSKHLHILAGIFSLNNLYSELKNSCLMRGMLVLFTSCQKQAKAVHSEIWAGIPS